MANLLRLVPAYSVTLTAALSSTATVLPISAGDAALLHSWLDTDHDTFLLINSPAGAELVMAFTLTASTVSIVRAQGGTLAIAHPLGACVATAVGAQCAIERLLFENLTAGLVGVADAADNLVGTTVEAALAELALAQKRLALTTVGAGASLIGVADPAGNLTGTTVEAALAELAAFKAALGLTTPGGGAAGVGITDTAAWFAATNVEAALAELASAAVQDRHVPTIAALRLLDKTKTVRAHTDGYYALGDKGGGAVYWYDAADTTTVDNGGSVIVGADGGRWKMTNLSKVNVLQFGADNTGVANASPRIQAALNASRDVDLTSGVFRLDTSIVPQHGSVLRGAGRGLDPYHDPAHVAHCTTTLVLAVGAKIDLSSTGNVRCYGMALKSAGTGNAISAYGSASNHTVGTVGFDITGSYNAQMENVSFHGLEFGVAASAVTNGDEARFWSLSDWVANDCRHVVKVGNATTTGYVARDFAIRECEIALHCGSMLDINWADGVRVDDCRFFQAYSDSVTIKNSPFVSLTGLTLFESRGQGLTLDNCAYATAAGLISSRAGGYAATTPWAANTGVKLLNCNASSVQGMVEHPGGVGVWVEGCNALSLSVSVDTPFYTNGVAAVGTDADAATNAAFVVKNSTAVALNCAVNTSSVIYALSVDEASAHEVTGTVATGVYAGVYRAQNVRTGDGLLQVTLDVDVTVGAGGSAQVGARQVRVPAGGSVVSRSAKVTQAGARVRSGAAFFVNGLTFDADGPVSFQPQVLATNGTAAAAWLPIPIQIHNPAAVPLVVLAGTRVTLSVGVV